MNTTLLLRIALPATITAFLVLAMVLPTWRLKRRTGAQGFVVHQAVNPFQQLIGFGMGVFMLALVVWSALVGLLGPAALGVWDAPVALSAAGWALIVAGFIITVIAQIQMGSSWRIGIDGKRTELVTHGLFRFVRNPIFSSMLLMVTGLVLVTPSSWTLMGWFHGALLMGMQARLEEQHLLAMHGESYRAYASRVGRFMPGIGRVKSDTVTRSPELELA